MESLHGYYATQSVSVSYRNLSSEAELAAHNAGRETLYSEKLGLPPIFFRGLHVGEFGPDTGENATCFARWGARLTLVEPNRKSHAAIREYFRRFEVLDRLVALEESTLEDYESATRFDFVNAEGFVGSIRPADRWLGALDRLLAPDGLFLISYFEHSGAWMEQAVSALTGLLAARGNTTARLAAEAVMGTKWKQVAHTRPFEAWFMDVIQNPFARQASQFDAGELLSAAAAHGFRLQASTPTYVDALRVGWYRRPVPTGEYLEGAREFLRRSRLGHMVGHKCFWTGGQAALGEVDRRIARCLEVLDQAIETPASIDVRALTDAHHSLRGALLDTSSNWLSEGPVGGVAAGLDALAKCFDGAGNGDMETVRQFAESDRWFLGTWGTPVHFAVFRREGRPA